MRITKEEDLRPKCINEPTPNQVWLLNLASPSIEVRVLNVGRNMVPGCEGHIHVAFATVVYPEGVPCGEIGMKGVMPKELWALLEKQNVLTLESEV